MKRIAIIAFVLSTFAVAAMPTKEELAEAQPIVNKLMKDHIDANKKGKESSESVGDAAMAFAKDAEGEAAKFALFKDAVTYYARGKAYEKAADAVEAIMTEVGDVPPQTLNGIVQKAAAAATESNAPRLVALKKTIGRRAKAAATLKELGAKLKKTPGDASLKRMHAELVAATGDWDAALEEFAALGGELSRIARLENPDVKPASDPSRYVSQARRMGEQKRQIKTRLKNIVIPNVEFKPPQTIIDAVEYFRNASYKYDDKKLPADKSGIRFILSMHEPMSTQSVKVIEELSDDFESDEEESGADIAGIPQIPSMTASQIKLYDLMKRICDSVDYKFVIRYGHVIILPKDMAPPETLGRSSCGSLKSCLEIAEFWHGYKCAAGVAAESVRAHAIEYYRNAKKDAVPFVSGLIEKCIKNLEAAAPQEAKGARQYDILKAQLAMVNLMSSIRLKQIGFKPPETIADAVEYFNKVSKELDPRSDLPSEKKGIKFVLKADAGKQVNMAMAQDITLTEAAHFVFEECCGCKIVLEGEDVVIK
jgi:hypothetical protein